MRKPINPYIVLGLAIILPGVGHIVTGRAARGLLFAFFTLLFMILTQKLAPADRSFVGRNAGGLFVWALSIPDAYRRARTDSLRGRPA